MKNTQFPLTMQRNDNSFAIVTAQGNFFAKTYNSQDALLIAASPDLLEALRDAANTLHALKDHALEQGLAATLEQAAITKIADAIAKAGQS